MPSPRILFTLAGAAVFISAIGLFAWIKNRRPAGPPPVVPPPARWTARPTEFVTDIPKSENTNDQVIGAIKASFIKGLRDRDWAKAASAFTPDFRGKFPALEGARAEPQGEMTVRVYPSEGLEETDGAGLLDRMKTHLEPWSLVERTTWRQFTFLLSPDEKRGWYEAHFQVAGPAVAGGRGDLQAQVEGEVVKEGETWKMRSLSLMEGFRVECSQPPFEDITDATGFHLSQSEDARKKYQEQINARVLNVSGGLTVLDWNHDGFPDFAATNQGRFTDLLLNDGKGGFTFAALPMDKPDESGNVLLSIDLDGDGVDELVTGETIAYKGAMAYAGIYTRKDGTWKLLPEALEFEVRPGRRDLTTTCVVPCDLNRDGLIDLYVGHYSDFHSKKEDFNFVAAYDGAGGKLFINHGGLKFTEESEKRGIVSTQYTLAAAFFDLDADGDEDLIQVNDFGPNVFWENQGKGTFREQNGNFLAKDSSYSMGISIADYDNRGDWSIHISNMYSHAGNRIVKLATNLNPEMGRVANVLAEGNWQFERDPATKEWKQIGKAKGVDWADWAWACLFWDYDNDTRKELFVTDGYTSHEDKSAPDW